MKLLAIKGHPTRGKELIEILEMLGGKNEFEYEGGPMKHASNYDYYYFIGDNHDINSMHLRYSTDTYSGMSSMCFTLEEFLEKFPYKVGDKVLYKTYMIYSTISSMKWDENKNQVIYGLDTKKMLVATADELQPCAEQPKEKDMRTPSTKVHLDKDVEKLELLLGNEYEIKVEDGKTYVVRKKPQYPKTYKECCMVLGIEDYCVAYSYFDNNGREHVTEALSDYQTKRIDLFNEFDSLLICRDAYWKLAGDWKPDLVGDQVQYYIFNYNNQVYTSSGDTENHILSLPTAEMRDAFHENFKDLIEECKELL